MRKKGSKNKVYSIEFKIGVIKDTIPSSFTSNLIFNFV